MNRDEFWQLIDGSRCGPDLDAQVAKLRKALSSSTPGDLVAFDQHLHSLLAESYSWNLWGAAYIINGGCSDDGFDYFRAWLVAQGRSVFESGLVNPDSLAELPEMREEEAELEELWYIAGQIHEEKTGQQIPDDTNSSIIQPELGEGWDFDDEGEMGKRYPNLVGAFWS